MDAPRLAIVVPCYNEGEVLEQTANVLSGLVHTMVEAKTISAKSHVLYVDDGSRDGTWAKISELSRTVPFTSGLKLSGNRGHQIALIAGMEQSKDADMVVTIDADLQDDPRVIREMVELASQGFDVVYGVRADRETDTLFKKNTAGFFYSLMAALGAKMIAHHADFRLTKRRVLDALQSYSEVNLFLRGIFPLIGFKSTCCYYKRVARTAGESKYPFKKMVAFAIEGITSFSVKPLRIVTYLGFFTLAVTTGMSLWTFAVHLAGHAVPGWSSILISIYFLASVQLVSLGVIGEYVGKIYQESKQRPRYHVEEIKLGSA